METASGGHIQVENFTGPGAQKAKKIKENWNKMKVQPDTWSPKSREKEKMMKMQRGTWGPESKEKEKEQKLKPIPGAPKAKKKNRDCTC